MNRFPGYTNRLRSDLVAATTLYLADGDEKHLYVKKQRCRRKKRQSNGIRK